MRRGWTLIELLIILAVVGILAVVVVQACGDYAERSRCLHGHEVLTGATLCKNNGIGVRCEPETRFICDQYKAER